ncbi:asparagine synthase [Leucobacter sp. Psy1]|uniref:asparagine synthase n=1 Tax=Leucobacter sp. Psy1 TaxID=2875729 RepID=UPI001CD52470|nr:asparagine synthase [Leucobacter sp. Psy1]
MFSRFFKRDRKRRAPRRLPRRVLAPVEEIVEQGLLVDDVAVRMNVKNAVIMNALKRGVDYDEQQIAGMVRTTLTDLADERDQDAQHIGRMLGEIRDTGSSASSDSEYGNDDNRTLRHRREVYETIASALRERAADDAYVAQIVERASEAAWSEISDSLKERASHPYYAGGASPEYQAARDDRIQQLIERDLTALVQQQSPKNGKSPRKWGKKRESE